MALWIIFDVALIAIFAFSIYRSMKCGMLKASKKVLSVILTMVIMASSHAYITAWFKISALGDKITAAVTNRVEENYDTLVPYSQNSENTQDGAFSFFDKIIAKKSSEFQNAQKNFTEVLTEQIIDSVLGIIALILLYIAIRLFLFVLFKILSLIFELPLLKSLNKIAGAAIGVVNALFAVYLITAVLGLFLSGDVALTVQEAISKTYITKYFYENNLLLNIFIK